MLSNKLSLSWEKTFFMIYHSPKKKVEGIEELKINNHIIKRVNNIVYLGMQLEDQLKWNDHVKRLCNSLTRNFHMFCSIRSLLTDQLKKATVLLYSLFSYNIWN